MSGNWIAIGRRVAAIVLTVVVITLLPLEHLPSRAGGGATYWFVFSVGIVVMLVVAGLIFKTMGIGFWRGIMEWIIISVVLVGLFLVLFPVVIGGVIGQAD